jgi:hypothetical protein
LCDSKELLEITGIYYTGEWKRDEGGALRGVVWRAEMRLSFFFCTVEFLRGFADGCDRA